MYQEERIDVDRTRNPVAVLVTRKHPNTLSIELGHVDTFVGAGSKDDRTFSKSYRFFEQVSSDLT